MTIANNKGNQTCNFFMQKGDFLAAATAGRLQIKQSYLTCVRYEHPYCGQRRYQVRVVPAL
jgi:hypothetical protein